jgi:hypothetical protein
MKSLPYIGVVLLLLGVFSFVTAIPQRQNHSVRIAAATVGSQTEGNEMVPVAASTILLGTGVFVLVLGSRKT